MMSGRRRPPAGRARLRSDSGRSRPRPQAVRSPTPALRRVPAGPRLLPTAHRRAGGRTPPDTRPRRRGRVAAGPGSIAPCPTPGPVPARTGRGRRQAAPRVAARAALAGPGRSPLGHAHHPPSRRPDRSSAQECGRAFCTWWPGGRPARGPVTPPALATAWHSGEHPRHSPYHRQCWCGHPGDLDEPGLRCYQERWRPQVGSETDCMGRG